MSNTSSLSVQEVVAERLYRHHRTMKSSDRTHKKKSFHSHGRLPIHIENFGDFEVCSQLQKPTAQKVDIVQIPQKQDLYQEQLND